MTIEIVFSLIIAVIALIISFLADYKQRMVRRKEKLQRTELGESLSKAFTDSFRAYYPEVDTDKTDYVLRDIRNSFVHSANLQTKPEIEDKVNATVEELKKRLEAIETRFPQESTLEKIASVNDAILATQLEALSDSIKVIQDRMLTKWDVAKIMFAILSALGILVGLVFWVIDFIK